MKRRSSTSVKKILHSEHTFSTLDSFPPGVLPTKRHVIERILHLKNFLTFNAANDIAREIYDRWVWCNVYPIHLYTISKKVQSFVNCFSALDRWSKKKRGEAFLQKEKEFMSTIDEIFDVFCADDKQRRILEKQHGNYKLENFFPLGIIYCVLHSLLHSFSKTLGRPLLILFQI